MAKAKSGTIVTAEELAEQVAAQAAELGLRVMPLESEEPDVKTRFEAISQKQAEAFIKVYRFQGVGQPEVYCTKMTAEQFDEESLRQLWGPGKYRVKLINAENGRILDSAVLSLEALPALEAPAAAPLAQVPALSNGSDIMAGIATLMAQSQRQIAELIAQAVGSRRNMFDELRVLREIMAPPVGAAAAVAPPVDITATAGQMMGFFLKGIELARGQAAGASPPSGEATDTDVLLAGIKEFGPLLRTVLGQPQAQVQPAPAEPQAPPGGAQPAPGGNVRQLRRAAPQANPGSEQEALLANLQNTGQMLVGQATVEANPYFFVDTVLAMAPAPKVHELLAPPDWFAGLTHFLPSATAQEEWFTDLRDMTLYAISHPATWRKDLFTDDLDALDALLGRPPLDLTGQDPTGTMPADQGAPVELGADDTHEGSEQL